MADLENKSTSQRPQWFMLDNNEQQLRHFHGRIHKSSHVWRPPTDVFETENSIIIRVEISGMRDADFSISLDGQSLTIYGVRPDTPERRAYHQMEIRFGEFKTEVELQQAVDTQFVEAEYHDGFLRLVLPKTQPQKNEIEN